MEITNLKTGGPLPAALANPAAIEKVSRKRASRPAPARGGLIPPLHVQLGREHLDAMREEIVSAEDVLLNVYEDIDMFDARRSALDDITFLLVRMRNRLDAVISGEERRADIRAEIDALADGLERAVESSKRRNMPLLKPATRVASPLEAGRDANLADIVFVVSRTASSRSDVALLTSNLNTLYSDLANRGVSAMFGVQTFERSSQPAGPLRASLYEATADLRSIYFSGDTPNALAAVRQTLEDQPFRDDALKVVVVLSDRDAADDYGSSREETLEAARASGAVVFAVSGNDFISRRPHSALNHLATGSGGAYLNINSASFADNLASLAEMIAGVLLSRGALYTETQERLVHIGPGPADSVAVRFPDYRSAAVDLRNLPLETEGDFAAALESVSHTIAAVTADKNEKGVLQQCLRRILQFFDGIRAFRLDFRA